MGQIAENSIRTLAKLRKGTAELRPTLMGTSEKNAKKLKDKKKIKAIKDAKALLKSVGYYIEEGD